MYTKNTQVILLTILSAITTRRVVVSGGWWGNRLRNSYNPRHWEKPNCIVSPPCILCLLRRFFRGIPKSAYAYPAGIKSQFESFGCLQDYKDLQAKSLDWNSVKDYKNVKGRSNPLEYIDSPPRAKKRKV